jgi:hypothetical protein
MGIDSWALIAGTISSLMFVSSHVPMLLKAYRTGDLHSYSSLNLIMVNVGNLVYWLYVSSLPAGPIWVLHTFYTVSSALLLVMYCRMLVKEFPKRRRRRFASRQLAARRRAARSAVNMKLTRLSDYLNIGIAPKLHGCGAGCR